MNILIFATGYATGALAATLIVWFGRKMREREDIERRLADKRED